MAAKADFLIDERWLSEHRGDPNLVLVDTRAAMPHPFERPRGPRRAHSGIVLVKNHPVARGDSESGKYPVQLRLKLGGPALAGVAVMKRERIEMARAGEMPGPEILARPRVDQHDVCVVAMLPEPSRIDE